MKVHCDEGVSTDIGSEPCVTSREAGEEASVVKINRVRVSLL